MMVDQLMFELATIRRLSDSPLASTAAGRKRVRTKQLHFITADCLVDFERAHPKSMRRISVEAAKGGSLTEVEHGIPKRVLAERLLDGGLGPLHVWGLMQQYLSAIAVVTVAEHRRLAEAGLAASLPSDGSDRYAAVGIELV